MKNLFIALTVAVVFIVTCAFTSANTGVTLIVTHEVKDFPTWKQEFDKGEAVRKEAGITLQGIYHAADNSKMVTVISEATSTEAVKKFGENPNLKASMEKAGVIGKPEFKILVKD